MGCQVLQSLLHPVLILLHLQLLVDLFPEDVDVKDLALVVNLALVEETQDLGGLLRVMLVNKLFAVQILPD